MSAVLTQLASLPEWSKGVDLRPTVSPKRVGSNPTGCMITFVSFVVFVVFVVILVFVVFCRVCRRYDLRTVDSSLAI